MREPELVTARAESNDSVAAIYRTYSRLHSWVYCLRCVGGAHAIRFIPQYNAGALKASLGTYR